MKHVMISGGAGFLGSHLCDLFLKQGYAVTAVDNLLTGRMKNLAAAASNPRFHFLKQNICEEIGPSSVPFLNQYGLHGLLHFACPASPVDFDRIPFDILEVDSIGTIKTVALALKYKCRYLLASTSEIYGDPLVHPQTETYWGNVNPIGPRACYDETKRFAEAYVTTATRKTNLNGGIVRIFNTYGPRMRLDDGRLIPELCRRALTRQPLSIHGEGQQTRSFCFVSDLTEGIFELFGSNLNEPVNLGNPVEYRILEVAQMINRLTENSKSLNYEAARVDDPKQRQPDLSRALSKLNWSPRITLEEGLQTTLDYFRTEL